MGNEVPLLTENEKRCLALILRRQKAERSPYIPIPLLKRISNYKQVIKKLHRKGLASYYKEDAVGLTEDGRYLALVLMKQGY